MTRRNKNTGGENVNKNTGEKTNNSTPVVGMNARHGVPISPRFTATRRGATAAESTITTNPLHVAARRATVAAMSPYIPAETTVRHARVDVTARSIIAAITPLLHDPATHRSARVAAMRRGDTTEAATRDEARMPGIVGPRNVRAPSLFANRDTRAQAHSVPNPLRTVVHDARTTTERATDGVSATSAAPHRNRRPGFPKSCAAM